LDGVIGQSREIRGQDPEEAFPLWVPRCCHGPTARPLLGEVPSSWWQPGALQPQSVPSVSWLRLVVLYWVRDG